MHNLFEIYIKIFWNLLQIFTLDIAEPLSKKVP